MTAASPTIRTLADETLIVFFSDSHIGGDTGHDSFESPNEFIAMIDVLSATANPIELVLAGDWFDFLAISRAPAGLNRASLTINRPEYQPMFARLRTFAAEPGRHVLYLPGNHDAEMWWNSAVRETLRTEGLVHEFVLSYAARFASRPDRLIYCEHGNQFDAANQILDYTDPLDTPLGHHIVMDVLPHIDVSSDSGMKEDLRDLNRVSPLVAIPGLVAGRVFYDLVSQVVRLALLPLFLAYVVFRVIAYFIGKSQNDHLSFSASIRSASDVQRLFIELGYVSALLLALFVVAFLVIRRVVGRLVSSTSGNLPGLAQGDSVVKQVIGVLSADDPMPMGDGIRGTDIDVFVSGHTHSPSLTEFTRDGGKPGVAVNSGCWLRQLHPVRAHWDAPSVYISRFVLTHVRIHLQGSEIKVELWERPKPADPHLSRVQRLAVRGRLPIQPPAGSPPAIIGSSTVGPTTGSS